MAIMNVNPTRMQLNTLKKRLATSRRGHKLLKDKRDELMRQFMLLVRENKELRRKVEAALHNANAHFAMAQAVMPREVVDTALLAPKQEVELQLSTRNIMSVDVPQFAIQMRSEDPADIYAYGLSGTYSDLDDSVYLLAELLPDMLRLAEVEKACQLMAVEIEKTRRRVNALEHVMIPQLEETIRYITMKLEENDNATKVRLLKVKEMVLEQAHDFT